MSLSFSFVYILLEVKTFRMISCFYEIEIRVYTKFKLVGRTVKRIPSPIYNSIDAIELRDVIVYR